MKITNLKSVQFNSARLHMDAINIAYGLNDTQTVSKVMENNVKKFANDTIKIFQLTEKMKLMLIQTDAGCKGKPYDTNNGLLIKLF